MANIFEGLQLETPTEAQTRMRQQLFARMASTDNPRQRAGVAIGTVLNNAINRFRTGEKGQGLFHRLGTGFASPEQQEAAENEQILTSASQDADAAVNAGTDPIKARADALMRASMEFSARGRGNVASQLQAQAMQLNAQIEVRNAELDKLRADTRQSNAQADALENKEPNIQDALIRLQNNRDGLASQLSQLPAGGPAHAAVARRLDEINQKIQKEITIVGRTEHDAGPTAPTMNLLQKSLIQSQSQYDQIVRGLEHFKPDFYTFGGRVQGGLLRFRDWIDDTSLSAEEKKELTERTLTTQAFAESLNAYIQQITGAQVGQSQEQDRLSKATIDIANDPPTVIEAKAKEALLLIPAVQARAHAAIAANDLTIIHEPLEKWIVKPQDDSADATRQKARELLGL
jgi:hypothetical protein